ncbi:MAG: response regulator [Bacteroidales bacterium]|nr:response regulator [Bacteroidales bacterium]
MAKKKILIVEDDKMLCTIFEMFIKQLGYELTGISHTGTEAIKLCGIERPDVVLMDIHLEGDINGIDAAKEIYKLYKVPVVYVTSDIEETTIKSAIFKNTYGFLMKPIYQSSLRVAIEFAHAKHLYDESV